MKDKAKKVQELVIDCLNGDHEDALVVEGIINTYGFSHEKIAAHKEEIRELLNDMPSDFHAGAGGGMSFLNLCMDKAGEQWAEHPTMESLVVLGIAADMAHYSMPRNMWTVLPGGMPYITFTTDSKHEKI